MSKKCTFDLIYFKHKFKGSIKMLVKNGFEGISHFMNHPEMLPYVGGEVLYVGECVNLPEVLPIKQSYSKIGTKSQRQIS